MLLYLQGFIFNMLFVIAFKIKKGMEKLLIYLAYSEINRYSHPYQIISRIVKYQLFVINIINLLGALCLISINLLLILISKLIPMTPETVNMCIWLRVMLLRKI